MGQSTLQVQGAVGRLAGDGLGAVLISAVAVEGPALDIRHTFQSRSGGDDLEDGAGNIGRLQKAVEVHALVGPGGVSGNIRHIVRVVGGRGHRAEQLPGFVIVDTHGPLPPVQCPKGRILHGGGKGQLLNARTPGIIVKAVDLVVACQQCCIVGNGLGLDAALPVPQPVHGGRPGLGVVGIVPPVGDIQQDIPVPVHHGAVTQVAVVIDMGRACGDHPLVCFQRILPCKKQHSAQKQHHEDGHHPGSLGNSVHSKLLFVKAHGEAGILPGVCRLDEGQQAPGPDHAGAAVGEERESNPRKGQNIHRAQAV